MCRPVTLDPMRITIEITDQQHSKLLEIAARRGERGFADRMEKSARKLRRSWR
jgi:hypothetical protein